MSEPTDQKPPPFTGAAYAEASKAVREALFSISSYDGVNQSVEGFLREVNTLFKTVKLDEEIFVRMLMVNRLTGLAREAFDNGAIVNSLAAFGDTLRQRFKQAQSYEALVTQRARMYQGHSENVLDYTTRFKRLQRDINLSVLNNDAFSDAGKKDLMVNEERLSCLQFVRGLLPEVRHFVQLNRPVTIDEASRMATQAHDEISLNRSTDALRQPHFNRQNARRNTGETNQNNQNYQRNANGPPRHFRANGVSPATTSASRPAQTNTAASPATRSSPRPSQAPQRGAVRCFICNGPHYRSECPVNASVRLIPEGNIPSLEEVLYTSSSADNEVTIKLNFQKSSKNFIIDTGARINLIKASAAKGCMMSPYASQFTGIGGTIVKTEFRVHYGQHVFLVVDDSLFPYHDGLVGRSFLRRERVLLDFGSVDIVRNIRQAGGSVSRLDTLLACCRLSHLERKTGETLTKMIGTYQDTFQLPGEPLPTTSIMSYKIETTDDNPIQTRQHRLPKCSQDEIVSQSADLLNRNIISHSNSPYNHPVHVVPKKKDASGVSKARMVIDLRKLNEKTPQDNYPLPNIEDIFDQLGKARYFSALDLASGFHQISLHPDSRHKTAFSTPQGHFEFNRLCFGLRNAPAAFQRMMNIALRGLIGKGIFVYLDDIIVFGTSLEEHNSNLEKLFKRLRQVGLKLQPDKCEFLVPELAYLGHIITPEGIKPNPLKLDSVRNFPQPTHAKSLKQFLGLASYYRKFVKDFSKIASPLIKLLRKDQPFVFSRDCQMAFEKLKDLLCGEGVILQYPDFTKEFFLTTDASDYAIGSVLEQLDDNNQRRPVAYASRTLNDAERNYSTIEKELLAIVWSVKHFRPYLYGRKFSIRTDHQPLKWLMNLKDPASRLMRWRIKLEEYNYEIDYVKGTSNAVADALSRNPVRLVRWKNHISQVARPSENAIPVYFSRRAEDKFKIIRSPEDDTLLGMRISLENLTPGTLREMLEEVVQLLISEDKNFVFLEYDKLTNEALLPPGDIVRVIKQVFNDPLIRVELGTEPLLTAHTPDEKKQIIQDYHDSLQAGHQGITKTLKMMLKRYYWRGIQKDVSDYIKKCATCQTAKHDRVDRKAPRKIVQLPESRNEKVALDIVGPLPPTRGGYKYILTLQDCLTKFAQAYPLVEQTTETILEKLTKYYIPSHGLPKSILTDQGSTFVSQLNEEFCELFKIQHLKCTPFHPESNGSLERLHGNLKEYLKANATPIHNWDQILPFFILYYNTSEQTSTGFSPFELTYGQKPFQLSDLTDTHGKTYEKYLTELMQNLDFVWNQAKLKDLTIKIKTTNIYNRDRAAPQYAVGQQVLVRAEESRKLGKGIRIPFEGPYEITRVLSPQNIEIERNDKRETIHINRVRPFHT
jgi:hypothetical protein